jgi:hypothetical protein
MVCLTRHRLFVAATVAVGLAARTLGAGSAQTIDPTQPNCVGQHVSEVAQTYGGMAAATAAHNAAFDTELSVGEHLALIRAECAG